MTDIAGLCERLRNFSETWSMYEKHRELTAEAADALERQAAEIERLRVALGWIVSERDRGTGFDYVRQVARAALTGEDTSTERTG